MDNDLSVDLKGRVALVTGASSGLGERFAETLALAGAKVVAGARRIERLQAVAERLRARGCDVIPVQLDVEDETSIRAAYDQAEAAAGRVDIVVANAGINAQGASVDLPSQDLGQLLRVNVQGVYLTAREGARRLIGSPEAERGRIILIGSVGSLKPLAGLTAYSLSKAAVAMMGKGFAREWARYGVTVNTICPGWIATELNSAWLDSDPGRALTRSFPRRRVMAPSDLDAMLLFLASNASASITGGVFSVDEGQVLA